MVSGQLWCISVSSRECMHTVMVSASTVAWPVRGNMIDFHYERHVKCALVWQAHVIFGRHLILCLAGIKFHALNS